MAKFLGEVSVHVSETPFKDYNAFDWAMYFIECYGQIDGAHHKQWVLDQVARIYNGTDVTVKQARWDDGTMEYRVSLDEPSEKYNQWISEMRGEYDEESDEYEYGYDEGTPP